MNESKAAGRDRVTVNYLTRLIREKKRAHGVPNAYYISEKTIINRIKRRRLDPPHPGVSSPIKSVKEALVQPLTPSEGLQLRNSLIRNQDLQEKLREFKYQCQLGGNLEHHGKVGWSYWTGFM